MAGRNSHCPLQSRELHKFLFSNSILFSRVSIIQEENFWTILSTFYFSYFLFGIFFSGAVSFSPLFVELATENSWTWSDILN